jgi:hypothetical protein
MSTAACSLRCSRLTALGNWEIEFMRAVAIHAAKDLRIDRFADPAPGPNQVRVRIAAGGSARWPSHQASPLGVYFPTTHL